MKTGIVLEGGAFRGLFTAGVLDCFMENQIQFDYIVGVSAGAGNALNFISGQKGRTKWTITADGENAYYGVKQMRKSKKMLDLDRMVMEFSHNQYPFDFAQYLQTDVEAEIVVTNCETGEAEYIPKQDDEKLILTAAKASCSVPILCEPVEINGYHYMDGSLADSIPVKRAVDVGCDRVIAVLTRKPDETPTNYAKMGVIMRAYKKKYPSFYDTLMRRTEMYSEQLELIDRLEREGKLLIIRPSVDSISKFEQDKTKQEEFYQHGVQVAEQSLPAIREFIGLS
ncbi:MAG: patatin family protein [Wujia sp.]